MAHVTYNEGESHILASYFQDTPLSFGPFYIGLGNGAAPLDEGTTLNELITREISETGYARYPVLRDASPAGWELRGDTVWSPELAFTNTGTTCWEPVNFAFLTLSASGLSTPTTLIAASDFKNSIVLKPGQTMRIFFTFRQITQYTNYQRLHCGIASITGYAMLFPPADAVLTYSEMLWGYATAGSSAVMTYAGVGMPAAVGTLAGDGVVV